MSINIFIIDFEIIFSKILIIFCLGRQKRLFKIVSTNPASSGTNNRYPYIYLLSILPQILLNNIPNNAPDTIPTIPNGIPQHEARKILSLFFI